MFILFLCLLCVVCMFMVFFDTCAPILCVYVLCSASADTVLAYAHVAMTSPSVSRGHSWPGSVTLSVTHHIALPPIMCSGEPIFTATLNGHMSFLKPFLLTFLKVCSDSQALPKRCVSDLD